MELFQSFRSTLKDYVFSNPIIRGIVAVILWIVGVAFIKAWRGKDEENNG